MPEPLEAEGQPLRTCRFWVCACSSVVALAWLVRQALDHVLGDAQAFPSFYVAIALVAWLAGGDQRCSRWPGLPNRRLVFSSPKYSLGVQDGSMSWS